MLINKQVIWGFAFGVLVFVGPTGYLIGRLQGKIESSKFQLVATQCVDITEKQQEQIKGIVASLNSDNK